MALNTFILAPLNLPAEVTSEINTIAYMAKEVFSGFHFAINCIYSIKNILTKLNILIFSFKNYYFKAAEATLN